MTNPAEIWRRRLWLWLPALVFFTANAMAWSVYKLGYAGQVEGVERSLAEKTKERDARLKERRDLEALVERVRTNRTQVADLYAKRFATRRQRLTAVTAEVEDLAAKAGLAPSAFNYPEEEIEDFGVVKRSFVFSVEGTYPELRKFINLLELSPSFLTVEQLRLTGGGEDGPELSISLEISTLFATEPSPSGGGTPAPPRPVS
jgi:hypothetical protein